MNGTLSKCFIVAAREIDNFFCCKLLLSAQRSLLVIRVSERNKLHECATSFLYVYDTALNIRKHPDSPHLCLALQNFLRSQKTYFAGT